MENKTRRPSLKRLPSFCITGQNVCKPRYIDGPRLKRVRWLLMMVFNICRHETVLCTWRSKTCKTRWFSIQMRIAKNIKKSQPTDLNLWVVERSCMRRVGYCTFCWRHLYLKDLNRQRMMKVYLIHVVMWCEMSGRSCVWYTCSSFLRHALDSLR